MPPQFQIVRGADGRPHARRLPRGKKARVSHTYTTIATFPSESDASRTYTVKQDETGALSCDCRGWTMKKPGQERSCKHTREVEADQQRHLSAPRQPAPDRLKTEESVDDVLAGLQAESLSATFAKERGQ